MPHPYAHLPDSAFWKRTVAGSDGGVLPGLFSAIPDIATARIATAGSCFAQHIGRALQDRGLNYLDYEPAPSFLSEAEADSNGYGVYSCRYGNIYTAKQLLQLVQEVEGLRAPSDAVWQKGSRFFDALRPGVITGGAASREEIETLRAAHVETVRRLIRDVDIFVFTMGLTECWVSLEDETAYPTVPGLIAGEFSSERYAFKNYRYTEIYEDLFSSIKSIRRHNPGARFLLTVSPVPLAATASGEHVLTATTYSKSVLRAVAGDLAADVEGVMYFPSFEVITGQHNGHRHYNDDLRTVKKQGVQEVMAHFFSEPVIINNKPPLKAAACQAGGFEHCEEALLGNVE